MAGETKPEPLFYVDRGKVWKRPTQTCPHGRGITLGFCVCTPDENLTEEGAEAIAELLNAGEAALAATASDWVGDAREALRSARAQIIELAEKGTERITDLGGACDPAHLTYGPAVARIDAAIAALPGGGGVNP